MHIFSLSPVVFWMKIELQIEGCWKFAFSCCFFIWKWEEKNIIIKKFKNDRKVFNGMGSYDVWEFVRDFRKIYVWTGENWVSVFVDLKKDPFYTWRVFSGADGIKIIFKGRKTFEYKFAFIEMFCYKNCYFRKTSNGCLSGVLRKWWHSLDSFESLLEDCDNFQFWVSKSLKNLISKEELKNQFFININEV